VLLEGVEGVWIQMVVSSSRDHPLDQMWVVVWVLLLANLTHLLSSMTGYRSQLAGAPMMAGFTEKVVPQCRQFHWGNLAHLPHLPLWLHSCLIVHILHLAICSLWTTPGATHTT
jgi:hypothetical protein